MDTVLASSLAYREFEPRSGQTTDYKSLHVTTQFKRVKAKTGCVGINIMCPIEATCPAEETVISVG